jgi:hypothetical protein
MKSNRPDVWTTILFVLMALPTASAQGKQSDKGAADLRAPVRVMAGGQPIDVTVGHAAPYVMDVDGDGVRDLLVGEFGKEGFPPERLPDAVRKKWGTFDEGKLRIYRNVGTNDSPRFDGFKYMEAGGEAASIPTT